MVSNLTQPAPRTPPYNTPLIGIVMPSDEFQLWAEVAGSNESSKELKAKAEAIYR